MKSINTRIILIAVLSSNISFDKEGKSCIGLIPDEMLEQLKSFAEVLEPGTRIEVATDNENYSEYSVQLSKLADNITVIPLEESEGAYLKYTDENIPTFIKNEDFKKVVFVLGNKDLHNAMIGTADSVMFLKTTSIPIQQAQEHLYPGPVEGKQITGRIYLEGSEFPLKPTGSIQDIEMFSFIPDYIKFMRERDIRVDLLDDQKKDAMFVGKCEDCGTVHVPTVFIDGHEPQYATIGSAGADLFADINSDTIVLQPMKRILIPTGVQMQLPEGFELQIRPKSGLAHKHGVTVLNTPGTIDCDYTGVIGVILINLGEEDFVITKGMKIAQAVLTRYERMNNVRVPDDTHFEKTDRGDGGFGSTGV